MNSPTKKSSRAKPPLTVIRSISNVTELRSRSASLPRRLMSMSLKSAKEKKTNDKYVVNVNVDDVNIKHIRFEWVGPLILIIS